MEATEPTIIKKCPECGLELADSFSMCACDKSMPDINLTINDPLLGTVLNNTYEIQEAVGRGGMGVVYKARDILMERAVAIKMLHAHLVSDQSSIQRFQQEARAASAINHPNVITAYDFGISESGQPYLIMDFLQGHSLSALIDENNGLTEDRAINIFAQCCDALHVAHSKGVVHRDLKPSNIMIVKNRDTSDFVKIVDFGIAKLMPSSGKQSKNLTQTGELFGSPLYMSPEQFLGKKLDERTDIYAMGCVMYESLIGKPPYSGEHVLETMYKHLNEPVVKFAVARPDLSISDKLENIVLRALEKDPDQRFQSMSELRDELLLTMQGAKDTRSMGARFQSMQSKLKRARKKNALLLKRLQFGMLILGAAALIAAGVFYALQGDRESQWLIIRREAQEAYRRGDLQKAEKKFFEAGKIARDIYGDDDPKYLDTLEKLAWIYEEQERYANARKLLTKIKGLSPEDVIRLKAAQILAYSPCSQLQKLRQQNVVKGPETALKAGIRELEKYIGPTDPGLLILYKALANTYEQQTQYAEAEDALIKIVSIREDSQGQESTGVADARAELANLYVQWTKNLIAKGYHEEAERTAIQAKESYELAAKLYSSLMGSNYSKLEFVQKQLAECHKLESQTKSGVSQ